VVSSVATGGSADRPGHDFAGSSSTATGSLTNVRLVRNLYKSLAGLEVLRYKPKTYWELVQKLHDRLGDSEGAWQMVDILMLHGQHLAVAVEQETVVIRLSPVDT